MERRRESGPVYWFVSGSTAAARAHHHYHDLTSKREDDEHGFNIHRSGNPSGPDLRSRSPDQQFSDLLTV